MKVSMQVKADWDERTGICEVEVITTSNATKSQVCADHSDICAFVAKQVANAQTAVSAMTNDTQVRQW